MAKSLEDAYVINLKSSTDRWAIIQKHFEGSNIKLHRYEPVHLNRQRFPFLTKREFGARSLALTFLKLVQMAKKKGLPEILILEDDCFPVEGFEPLWEKVKSWLRSHEDQWEVYSGGSIFVTDPFIVGCTSDLTFYVPKHTCCTQWMWVKQSSYDKVIRVYKDRIRKGQSVATDHINDHLRRIISYPFVSYQNSPVSTLSGKEPDASMKNFKREEKALSKYRTCKLFHRTPGLHNMSKTKTRKQKRGT